MLVRPAADGDTVQSADIAGNRGIGAYALRRLRPVGTYFVGHDCADAVWRDALRSTYLTPIDELQAELEAAGHSFVSFANYDYLGLADDPRIKEASCGAIQTHGLGAGASRLVGGERSVHAALEADIADFIGVEDALTLVSGFLTNVSLIGHVLGRRDLVIADELSHNSVLVGGQLTPAPLLRFAHNDLDDLEHLLSARRAEVGNVLIVVEGLYSMDGDIPDLPRLLAIKERYDAWLMIDEAHSFGVLGPTGRGIAEHFGVDPKRIDIIMGTLSKALGACGGFIAGGHRLIEWLRFSLPAFVFSVGLAPAIAVGASQALAILRAEPWRVAQVQQNSTCFVAEAQARGLDTGSAIGAAVVPAFFPDRERCITAAQTALAAGFYAPPIAQMAVPAAKPRIRFFISAKHSHEQITGVLNTIASL